MSGSLLGVIWPARMGESYSKDLCGPFVHLSACGVCEYNIYKLTRSLLRTQ